MAEVKPNLQALLTVYADSVQELQNAIAQVRLARSVFTATDDALDILGEFVGENRGGSDDATYRTRIQARIAANRSLGNVPDLINVVRTALANDPEDLDPGPVNRVFVDNRGGGTVIVRLESPESDEIEEGILRFLQDAVSAGVRVILETPFALDANTRFRFPSDSYAILDLSKIDDLAEDPINGPIDTVLRSAVKGSGAYSIRFEDDGSGAGTLDDDPDAVFHFDPANTTVADFETAVGASTNFDVLTAGTFPAATFGGDGVGPALFTPGTDDDGIGAGYAGYAKLDLAPLTANIETVIRAADAGANGNTFRLALVADGSGAGSFTNSGTDYTFHFQSGVTTVANWEAAVAGSGAFAVYAGDGTGGNLAAGDAFALTALTGGLDGGSLAQARD